MKKVFLAIFALSFIQYSQAQTPPDGLIGADFRAWVKFNFYDGIMDPLGYTEARQRMYFYAENFNDTVECLYSGYKKFVEGGVIGPTPSPLNAEHIVPQSLYNEDEPMRGDMHILYPTYDQWNTKRSNNPFDEINDNSTDEWVRNDVSMTSIPTSNIDEYSESLTSFAWEPRESRKGDVARAVFYFFTMYPAYDIRFVGDTDVLCDWHEKDMVDSRERTRNNGIVAFQDNTNPYVDNPQWANQAYGCEVVVASTLLNEQQLNVFPNPASDKLQIQLDTWKDYPLIGKVFNGTGQLVYAFPVKSSSTILDVREFTESFYVMSLYDRQGNLIGKRQIVIQ